MTVFKDKSLLICSHLLFLIALLQLPNFSLCIPVQTVSSFRFPEESPPNTLVGHLFRNGILKQQLHHKEPSSFFNVSSGVIRSTKTFDRENISKDFLQSGFKFIVTVEDDQSVIVEVITVNVFIDDVNDNTPQFPEPVLNVSMSEAASVGYSIVLPLAYDKDAGNNGTISYSLLSQGRFSYFVLVYTPAPSESLLLVTQTLIDRDTQASSDQVKILACDNGNPPKCTSLAVNVQILDVNDNGPVFEKSLYSVLVYENFTVGETVVTVRATDADSGNNGQIKYSVFNSGDPLGQFAASPLQNGDIKVVNVPLDAERQFLYTFLVIAEDGGEPPKKATATVKVTVLDCNDNKPRIIIDKTNLKYGWNVIEGYAQGFEVASITVLDDDKDMSNNQISKVVLNDSTGSLGLRFVRDVNKKEFVYSMYTAVVLDREKTGSVLKFSVTAYDNGSPTLNTTTYSEIYVGDENDNAPTFDKLTYLAVVNETADIGQLVIAVQATDLDYWFNSEITYYLMGSPYSSWFVLNNKTGELFVNRGIDREIVDVVNLTVMALDGGNPRNNGTCVVIVTILDANDNAPFFTEKLVSFTVLENKDAGTVIGSVSASDKDVVGSQNIRYSLANATMFGIDPITGAIKTLGILDREILHSYYFEALATDDGGLTGNVNVVVSVLDVNDYAPRFMQPSYTVSVHENTFIGGIFAYVTAVDLDEGTNAELLYSKSPDEVFAIESYTGGIKLLKKLDRSVASSYQFTMSVQDIGGLKGLNVAQVTVDVIPASTRAPHFDQASYVFSVAENTVPGYIFGSVVARRNGSNSTVFVNYTVENGNIGGVFKLDDSGVLRLAASLDYEQTTSYNISVRVFDMLDTSLTASTLVAVLVLDENDNDPTFVANKLFVDVSESVPVGFTIHKCSASDLDSGSNGKVTYSILNSTGSLISIDADSGEVFITRSLDYEEVKTYDVYVRAVDGGEPPRSAVARLIVNVVDENDNAPVFKKDRYSVHVAEDTLVGKTIVIIEAEDVDSGKNGQFSFHLIPSADAKSFHIMPTGEIILVKAVDRESKAYYSFICAVRDYGTPFRQSQTRIHIVVDDVNDESPVFEQGSYSFTLQEELPPGQVIGHLVATDADTGSNGIFTFSLREPSKLFAVETSGLLYPTKTVCIIQSLFQFDREKSEPSYNFTVLATDHGFPKRSTEVLVTVLIENINDMPPRFPQETPFLVFVEHGTKVGAVVTVVTARDDDVQPYPLKYKLLAFTEEEKTALDFVDIQQSDSDKFLGIVRVKNTFGPASKPFFEVTVCVEEAVDLDPHFNYQKLVIFTGPKIVHKVLQTSSVEIPISEKTKSGSYIYSVQAASMVGDVDWFWKYRIENDEADALPFRIDEQRGIITTTVPLLHRSFYQVRVEASGRLNGNAYRESMFVNIYVIAENKFPPQYPRNPVVLSVREDWMPYQRYLDKLDNATDADFGMNGKCMFSIVSSTPERSPFKVHPLTGEVIFTTWMDREKYDAFVLIAQVSDLAVNISQRLTTTFTIHLLVFDVNDNRPVFTSVNSTYVFEDDLPGTVVANVKAHDPDVGQTHTDVVYQIIKGNEDGKFDIDLETGLLKTSNFLDIRVTSHYVLTILAQEVRTEQELKMLGISSLNSTTQVSVEVVDVNDKQPNFTRQVYEAFVREDATVHSVVVVVTATDDDFGTNAEMEYGLSDHGDVFYMNRSSGAISLKQLLDREVQELYTIHVTVKNTVYPFYLDTATVAITVLDVNDFAPVFSDGSQVDIFIMENSPVGFVHTFLVTDADIGANAEVEFKISPESVLTTFSVDKKKGTLSVLQELDREKVDEYLFTVTARNTESPYHAAAQSVKITVGDVNDEPPRFSQKSFYAQVGEDTPLKVPILNLQAVDKDVGSNAIIIYSLPKYIDGSFGIDPDSGDIFLVAPLDYEENTSYSFSVKALGSQGSQSDEAQVKIDVIDRNDNAPRFSKSIYEVLIPRLQTISPILTVLATDADEGGKQGVTYALEPASLEFTIDAASGEIKIASTTLTPGQYRLHVKAEDIGFPPLQNWAQVFVTVGSPDKGSLKFLNTSVHFRFDENPPVGYQLGRVIAAATSGDLVSYSIVRTSNPDGAFGVDPYTGDLYVNNINAVDYELHPSFLLGIVATVSGIGPRSIYLTVAVDLNDINDNDPQIFPKYSKFKYTETNQVNFQPTYLHSFLVSDKDKIDDGKLRIELISGNDNGDFKVDPSQFWLLVVHNIDYERQREYSLVVRVTDGGSPVRFSDSNIVIEVEDQNDNPPVFQNLEPVFVSEAAKVGMIVANITTADADATKSETTYSLQRSPAKNASFFHVDKTKGTVSLARVLDYEAQQQHVLNISAYDGVHTTYAAVIINVVDVNDFEPVFSHSVYEMSVQETVPINQYLGQVLATDRDSGEFGHVQYKLDPPQDAFTIDQETGRIYASKEITFRKGVEPYRLTVVAFDSGGLAGSKSSAASVYLRVSNTVSITPTFGKRSYHFAVSEASGIGSFVGMVSASLDFNSPRTLVYEISSLGTVAVPFVVDKFKGVIAVNSKLDREVVDRYAFKVEVRVHNDPTVIPGECAVEVKVEDANDNPPVFAESEYTIAVRENLPERSVLLQVQATDADEPNTLNSRVRYAIHSGQDKIEYLYIHPRTGLIKTQKILDREYSPELRLTIRATDYDGKGLTAFASLVVKLIDENDNSPIFEFNAPNLNHLTVDENKPPNTTVFKATATDKDAGRNGLVEYRIINGTGFNKFRIVNSTGWVFTNAVFDFEQESVYSLIVLAQDHGEPPRATSFEYRVAVNDVNEFRPRFDKVSESFVVLASAEVGSLVGKVTAYDADKGSAGVVYYSFLRPHGDELFIEESSGMIFVGRDLRRHSSRRKARSSISEQYDHLRYIVEASNGPNTTLIDTMEVQVSVNYSCPGCVLAVGVPVSSGFKPTTLVVVLVSLSVFTLILFLVCVFIYVRRKGARSGKRSSPVCSKQKPRLARSASFEREYLQSAGSSREPLHGQFYTDIIVPPGSSIRESSENNLIEEKSRSQSASVTDKGSTHSFGVYHEQSVPDSGIQTDFGFPLENLSIKDLERDSVFGNTFSDFSAGVTLNNGSAFSFNSSKRSASRTTTSIGKLAASVGRETTSVGRATPSVKHSPRVTHLSLTNVSHESLNDFKEEGGGEAAGGMDVGNLLYAKLAEVHADERDAVMDGTRPFRDEGMPSHGGSLSTIITSDDEIGAAYHWGHLKDWRPSYNPVHSVFSGIGRVQNSTHSGGPAPMGGSHGNPSSELFKQKYTNVPAHQSDMRPASTTAGNSKVDNIKPFPSLRTPIGIHKPVGEVDGRNVRALNVFPLSKRQCEPNAREELQMTNLMSTATSLLSSMTSLPRTPQSLHSNYTSAVVSPNFTPAFTPLVARSPSVSSLGSPEDYFLPVESLSQSFSANPPGAIVPNRAGSSGSPRSNSSRITLSDLDPSENEIEL